MLPRHICWLSFIPEETQFSCLEITLLCVYQSKADRENQEIHFRSADLIQTKTALDEVRDNSLFLLTLHGIIFYTFKGSS